MITLNINKMELPVFNVVQATPILIPLDIDNKNILSFEIPNVNKYFTFESMYLTLIAKYMVEFSKVNFLTVKEFSDMTLKEKMMKRLMVAFQNFKFKKDFLKIIVKYFTGNFKLKKIYDIVNPMILSYLFLFIHCIIENVKKNFHLVALRMGVQMKEIFSTSLKSRSAIIEPRY